ncbi:hypothetical protein VSH64_36030 [Amycolatopsis rhabdoformis]|uniref:DUF4190 domain-containing protein n=1 Tax=Amycolatopsis rhabdoformis TaxID=1448059 RepID=A0ABZ1I3H7_9PSEU|nr:hypothetical protein [Amycolatopsis rhabdoformis]WSE28210.1 hypothetical protein VSH64_36030 [Amycolatopsis rhabdoformis]
MKTLRDDKVSGQALALSSVGLLLAGLLTSFWIFPACIVFCLASVVSGVVALQRGSIGVKSWAVWLAILISATIVLYSIVVLLIPAGGQIHEGPPAWWRPEMTSPGQ